MDTPMMMRSGNAAVASSMASTVELDTHAEVRPRRIAFLASVLNNGGAERQLVTLACALKAVGHHVAVVTFYPGVGFAPQLEAAGIEHVSVDKHGRWDLACFAWRLARTLRALAPDFLLSYLTVPNVFAALLRPVLPGVRVVWGIRASALELSKYDWGESVGKRLEVLLSRVPALIIANSHAGFEHHLRLGFPADRVTVIPNGIDADVFAPDASLRERTRRLLGFAETDLVIGCFARLDPMKGHRCLMDAFGRVAVEHPTAQLLILGDGSAAIGAEIDRSTSALGLQDRLHRRTSQRDVTSYLNACDVAISASLFGEGFSNAIAEAMACGIACVVTDVGDSARVVGETGVVVRPDDPVAMAVAMSRLLSLSAEERGALGGRARQRIIDNFSVASLAERTQRALAALA